MPAPISILVVLGSLGGGGTERQVIQLLRRLDRRRFKPYLYLVFRTGELLGEVPADVPVLAYGDRLEIPRWNYPGRLRQAQVRHLAKSIFDHQIRVVYDRTIHATLVAGEAARRNRCRRVSVVVNDPRLDLEASGQKFVWMKRWLLRRAYRYADRVVGVSSGVSESVTRYYRLPPGHVTTINNLFDLEELDRRATEYTPSWEPGHFDLVAAGRFQEQKGFSTLIEALDRLVHQGGRTQLRLHLIGHGPLEASIRSQIAARRLEPYVELKGFCPNPLPLFRGAHLFCLPSLFEGLPNALVEALAVGTPAVASDCPSGPREVLDSGRFGVLVPPGDCGALAAAIGAMMDDYQPWRRRAQEARDHLEREYSATAGMARWEKLLAELATLPVSGK